MKVVTEWFRKLMGEGLRANDVFIALTVDPGGNVVNAIIALGAAVVLCGAHRLNTVLVWMLGIGGTQATCKSAPMQALMKKPAACVGKFSHSVVNNSELRTLHELVLEFCTIYERIGRNLTRWTTQRNMMDRLLLLKALIVECFRLHESDKRRLSLRDWLVTNDVCSVPDPVAEVNIKIQGAQSTYISQVTFIMKELLEVMSDSKLRIRMPDRPQDNPLPYDDGDVADLNSEVQTAVDACVEYMGKKNIGEVGNAVERVSMLLDPRRTAMMLEDCVNGGNRAKQLAINDVELLAGMFVKDVLPEQTAASVAAAPAPAPGGDGSTAPWAEMPRELSVMEQRCADILAAAGAVGIDGDGAESGSAPTVTRKVRVNQELARFPAEGVEPNASRFSLTGYWLRRASPTIAQDTWDTVAPVSMPHVALLARLHHGVEATTCQAEGNFSAHRQHAVEHGRLYGTDDVLRLDQMCIPEIKAYNTVVDRQEKRRNQCREDTETAQKVAAGNVVEIDL